MKKYIISFTLLCVTFNTAVAQELSKEEKKELLLEIKEMKQSPEKLMKMKQDLEFADIVVDQQTEIIADLKKEAQVTELKLSEAKAKLETTEAKLLESNKTVANLSSKSTLDNNGTKYRVQVGLYKNLDFSYLLEDPKFMVHEFVDGNHRYSIGNFNSEEEAEAFKVELRRMGIKGAFVSTYTNGNRTDNISMNKSVPTTTSTKNTALAPVSISIQPKAAIPSTSNANVQQASPNYSKSIESNPNNLQNGTVISSTPVKEVKKDEPVKQDGFQFKEDETSKTNGIKINVNK